MTGFHRKSPAQLAVAAALPSSKNVRVLRKLWPYLRQKSGAMAGAIAAILVGAAAVLAFGQGLRGIVDRGLAGNDTASLNQSFLIMIAIIIVLSAASFCRLYMMTTIGESLVVKLRRNLFAHLLELHPGFFESASIGEILSRLTTDTSQVQTVINTSFPIALRNSILLVGAAFMMFITSPKLAGLVFLVIPLVIVPLVLFGRRVRKLSRASQERVAKISAYGDETLHNIKTVQAYTHENFDQTEFDKRVDAAYQAAMQRGWIRGVLSALIIGLVFTAIAIVLWLGGYDVLAGRISGGELASFVFYAVVMAGSVAALSEVASDLQRAAGSTERILELLAAANDIPPPQNPVPLPDPLPLDKPMVEFIDVGFHYPSRPNQHALKNFSLRIDTGESIGIVGASGGGKTTLFQLLLRFYDAQEGKILVGGVDIKNVHPRDLRQRISFVSQDPVIFSASLLDNIRYGRPDAPIDDVMAVCRLAKVDEFLPILPDGINTFLGERGTRLSGGQKQRVAIARAMLRNPDILLLDEATSQLDSENEKLVQAAIEKLAEGRTTITIAHRLSTLRDADRIVVLEDGHQVGIGAHEELMEQSAVYQKLVKLQMAV